MPTIGQLVSQDTIAAVVAPVIIEHNHSRETFAAQRKAALAKQRDGVKSRLDNLRSEVASIRVKALADSTSAETAGDLLAKLERMSVTERRLVDDVARLNAKIV